MNNKKVVIGILVGAVLAVGIALLVFRAQLDAPQEQEEKERSRADEIREMIAVPREEPLTQEEKERIRNELGLPREGGALTQEEKERIRNELGLPSEE